MLLLQFIKYIVKISNDMLLKRLLYIYVYVYQKIMCKHQIKPRFLLSCRPTLTSFEKERFSAFPMVVDLRPVQVKTLCYDWPTVATERIQMLSAQLLLATRPPHYLAISVRPNPI